MKQHLLFITIIILASSLILTFCSPKKGGELTIGVLTDASQGSNFTESDSIFQFINQQDFLQYKEVDLIKLEQTQVIPTTVDILWIHIADTNHQVSKWNISSLEQSILQWLNNGGNLLLTGEAIELLYSWGLEDQKPGINYAEAIDYGYGRKLGFHAYLKHPLFKNMHGGAYVFNPVNNQQVRSRGYFGKNPPRGKVIGIEWSYITFHENNRLILEHNYGKGKIISIGAFIQFRVRNQNQQILEQLLMNTFNYLQDNDMDKGYFWHQGSVNISQFTPDSVTISTSPAPKIPEPKPSSIAFDVKHPNHQPWDLTGERIMITGEENAGIEELWAHPFMALKDYHAGLLLEDSTIVWLNHLKPELVIDPAFIQRTYQYKDITLTEIIAVHHEKGLAAIHYECNFPDNTHLLAGFSTNLRLMWPYSHTSIGEIQYAWHPDANAFQIKDKLGLFHLWFGSRQTPSSKMIGAYDSISFGKNQLPEKHSDGFKVSAMMTFKMEDTIDLIIAAGIEPDENIRELFIEGINNPAHIFDHSMNYYQQLSNQHLLITSPEQNFNNAYQWAIVGADRHFTNTPGIGKSLVAGIGNTQRGWWGGHEVNGRPGYAWYFGRDSEWSGMALNAYGDFEKVKDILQLLVEYQSPDGKIFHELTTSGAVHYDAADATPLFIVLAGKYLRASGDTAFLHNILPAVKKAMDFCYHTDTDHDLLIENTGVGHGWVEGGFLFGGQTTLYLASCWAEALKEGAFLHKALDKNKIADQFEQDYTTVVKKINDLFYNSTQGFYFHSLNKDQTLIEEHTIMPSIPMYFSQLPEGNVSLMLNAFASNNFSSNWGCRIVGEDNKHFSPGGYHTGSVWPLYTGWVSLAEYKYGNQLQGFTHVMNNLNIYADWSKGFIEEVLHGAHYQPIGVCAHQCWSETMALLPLIEGMLGMEADGLNHTLKISPAPPAHWNSLKVENIMLGQQKIHLKMRRKKGEINYNFISYEDQEITVLFNPVLPPGTVIESIGIDDEGFSGFPITFTLNKLVNVNVRTSGGISVLPVVYQPEPEDHARGIRIISDELHESTYAVQLEAPGGTTGILDIWSAWKLLKAEGGAISKKRDDVYELAVKFPDSNDPVVKTVLIFPEIK